MVISVRERYFHTVMRVMRRLSGPLPGIIPLFYRIAHLDCPAAGMLSNSPHRRQGGAAVAGGSLPCYSFSNMVKS